MPFCFTFVEYAFWWSGSVTLPDQPWLIRSRFTNISAQVWTVWVVSERRKLMIANFVWWNSSAHKVLCSILYNSILVDDSSTHRSYFIYITWQLKTSLLRKKICEFLRNLWMWVNKWNKLEVNAFQLIFFDDKKMIKKLLVSFEIDFIFPKKKQSPFDCGLFVPDSNSYPGIGHDILCARIEKGRTESKTTYIEYHMHSSGQNGFDSRQTALFTALNT